MKPIDAYRLLAAHRDLPIFSVKIGIGSPQVSNVEFEDALEEFSRCGKWTTEYMEYVYVYVADFVKDAESLNLALTQFNLGPGRGALNTYKSEATDKT
jgi:hypothetical protein